MMKKGYIFLLAGLLLTMGLMVSACSENSDNPAGPMDTSGQDTALVWQDSDSSWYALIDATDYDSYAYFNLATREFVTLTDEEAETSSDWHIAFNRINGKLNGGASGPLGMTGVDLADLGVADSTNFNEVTEVPAEASGNWESDQINLAVDGWYVYNSATHALTASDNLYVMTTADGKYAKFTVDSLFDGSMPPNMGSVEIKYVYQPDGSADLSGNVQTATLDIGSDAGYFSFAEGGLVTVSDPDNSTDWDLKFYSYECETNGGINGPGDASIYPMYLETNDFESVTSAPQGGGYFTDAIQSVFGAPNIEGSEWYDYDSTAHTITSRQHVYLLRVSDSEIWKLEVTNYYNVVDEIAISGWITVHFDSLTD